MLKTFDKEKAGRGCRGTIFGTSIFMENMEGYLDELVWGYLKKGMKVWSHRHLQKEFWVLVRGKGTVQINDKEIPVRERDVVFIPSDSVHTTWNEDNEELKFILVRGKKMRTWTRRLVKTLPI